MGVFGVEGSLHTGSRIQASWAAGRYGETNWLPSASQLLWLFTDDGVALGVGVQSSEERHAGRFLLALGKTGTGGGDAGCRIHLVRAHRGSGIGVRCDHHDVAALVAQALDLARQVCAPLR
jgi:GNAT superfamily N-acetyltransferase